jgi:nucleotide-binding universal stress UspA family protein
MPMTLEVVNAIIDGQEKIAVAGAKAARHTLAEAASRAGAKGTAGPERNAGVTCSFRSVTGRMPPVLEDAAKLADLVVFGPLCPPQIGEMTEAFLAVLTKADRPVLVAPVAPLRHLARDVAIGWDGSMSAAHALTAAMPFLCSAETISLLCVNRGKDGAKIAKEAKDYLSLYGLTCTERHIERSTRPIGEVLVETAENCGADLLVIGGYGHSHLRETIFGGATFNILSLARLPVFLAH